MFSNLRRDKRGAIALITAFALPAMLLAASFAIDAAWWLVETRRLQNVADSAAVSAAFAGKDDYADAAIAIAAELGYADETDGVVVKAQYLARCPKASDGCYVVTISRPGSAMLSGLAPTLTASARTADGIKSGGQALVE